MGVSEKLAAFGGFPAREVSRGREAANRKSGCNKERRGAGGGEAAGPPGRPAAGGGPTRPARRTCLFRRARGSGSAGIRPGHGAEPCTLGAREGAATRGRRILSPGRDSHSSLSESLPSPSRNAAGHVGLRAGFADPAGPTRKGWERCREGRALCVGPRQSWSIHPYCLSLVALFSLRWGPGRRVGCRIGATVFLFLTP